MVPGDDTTGYSSGPVPSAALLEKLVLWEKLALLVVSLGGSILLPRPGLRLLIKVLPPAEVLALNPQSLLPQLPDYGYRRFFPPPAS